MKRITSVEDFHLLYERLTAPSSDTPAATLVISAGTCGQASGANELIRTAKREILKRNLSQKINLRITGCHGFCEAEASVLVEPMRTFYPKVTPESLVGIIEATVAGTVVHEALMGDPVSGKKYTTQEEIPFFKNQKRSILSRNERLDPIRIYNYIENKGYMTIIDLLQKNTPEKVITEVKASGLRGRGGAGFPTGTKWEMLRQQPGDNGKYIVCNADEGDPGAYMDRSVLEGNPHSVIEGMIIAAFATGATEGVIYVRKEYPLAIKHLLIALRQARELGLLGSAIAGTGFSFDIQIVQGAGAFVCGEETALMRSIEGAMGEPRQRPPFPVTRGILGKPTVINNVETWANIPIIMSEGSQAYSKVGTANNSGTKIFSLVGKVKNTGLVEIPMGATIDKIVNEIGGGPSGKAAIKAIQTGGPSGGCIPVSMFHLPIDYDSLTKAGSIMGSGGMIVMDENTCMVDIAKYFMNFLKDESCGKCFTCRKGTQRMYEILDDITQGKGSQQSIALLKELAVTVKDTTMCALGQTASNPVLSTLHYFKHEYDQHVEGKRCQAGVCKSLITYSITDGCIGCHACVKACPVDAISGTAKKVHSIDRSLCTKCGACKASCRYEAIAVT
ncbi:MAG: 4Fe-4S binding protein [Chitinivibrionales bacterium]|nr:4Fe-4S binding protein [Chitinivibrionales bacterium]